MNEFHFLRPAWFLLLVPMSVLLALLWRRGSASGWRAIVSPALLSHLLLDQDRAPRRLPLALLGIGWLLAVVALAGPVWERQPQPVYRTALDRVLVLDMSPSMSAQDIKPDRLTRARFEIRNLLRQAREGRTALVVFGAEPHVVAPLTDDSATIEALLPALTTDIIPAPGDRSGPALRLAADLLQRVGADGGEVLLLSDGVADPADSIDAIQQLRSRGVRTSVLGLGTLAGAPSATTQGGFETNPDGGARLARLDESGLTALADAGGGRYQRLGNGPVEALLTESTNRDAEQARIQSRGQERWAERGYWLLLPLLLIAASGYRRGWLGALIVISILPPPAHAFEWRDLWLRPDQQGSRLLEQGEAAAAAERFEHPNWRALARYEAGDYAGAAEGFAGQDPDSLYNRGNALAKAGRLQEALTAYDQALALEPGHEDAKFNRNLVEKLLQGQQQTSAQNGAPTSNSNESSLDQTQSGNGGADQAPAREQQGNTSEPGSSQDRTDQAANPSPQGGNDSEKDAASAKPFGPENQAAEKGPSPPRPGASEAAPADSAEQARADVAQAVGDNSDPPQPSNAPAAEAQPTDAAPGETPALPDDMKPSPVNEKQLALEQWLRQIPDDPAGLLRRKFMLEHLRRQQGKQRL